MRELGRGGAVGFCQRREGRRGGLEEEAEACSTASGGCEVAKGDVGVRGGGNGGEVRRILPWKVETACAAPGTLRWSIERGTFVLERSQCSLRRTQSVVSAATRQPLVGGVRVGISSRLCERADS
eukprot:1678213-Rhodomonas_salina.1